MIKRLAVIGTGLIGSSLALALKKAGAVGEVVGYDTADEAGKQALKLAVIDSLATSVAAAVDKADMVFLAVPALAMADSLMALKDKVGDDAIITDGVSVKGQVVAIARDVLGERFSQFVPGHPVAGTEKSGPSAAFATLYHGSRVILTPVDNTSQSAYVVVCNMWQQVGAQVVKMDIAHHDILLAATSHLPHLLAFNLVAMLAESCDGEEVLHFAAGGFRDFSRIASSNGDMWRDICLANKDAILDLLTQYQQGLSQLGDAIRGGDGEALLSVFTQAKHARDKHYAVIDKKGKIK